MQLDSPQEDGESLRKHLEMVPFDRLTDEDRALLDERARPAAVHLWFIYLELALSRRSGFGGIEPIGFDQVFYWQRLYGRSLMGWELRTLSVIDARWRSIMSRKRE